MLWCSHLLQIILARDRSNVTDGRYDAPESFFGEFVNDTRRVFDNATAYNYDTDHVFFQRWRFLVVLKYLKPLGGTSGCQKVPAGIGRLSLIHI